MTNNHRTFSESWHRVANLRVRLRPAVTIRKQMFRGETWYILQDPFNNQFFRIRPEAHEFIARLGAGRTVAQIWEECLARNPDGAPGQEDVIHLLAQFHHANLLFSELPVDSRKLFERYHKGKQREIRSKWVSLMFFRIPLFDPEPLLRRCPVLVRFFTGRLALFAWLLALGWAGMTVFDNIHMLISESKALLDFDNLALLWLGVVFVKILHESGHTLVCKRFGGEVHTVGVMLVVFAPLPYMDATSSWGFRSRRNRILVAASGMIFEFFAASCAALVWANSGPGVFHSLALNMMIAASVSTLVFNANPLLRFDGYYILSDLIDIPNLQHRSLAQLTHMAEHYLFGATQSASPADTPREASWLAVYGVLSFFYRIIVYGGIILLVSDRFLLAGMLMAAFCVFSWGVLPAARVANYLFSSPNLAKNRHRAIAVSAAIFGFMLFVIGAIPFQHGFRAPGIVEATNNIQVVNNTPGKLTEILAENGSGVEKGDSLMRLVNPELDIEIKLIHGRREEVGAILKQSAVFEGDGARKSLLKQLSALDDTLQKIRSQQRDLIIRAELAGTWIAPGVQELRGVWLNRGTKLGKLVSTESFRFSAVVSQEEAANLFKTGDVGRMTVRLNGQADTNLDVSAYTVIPFQHERLPSAALGWEAGGDIPVSHKDKKGLRTVEPFFQIYADLKPSSRAVICHGHSGQIRFSLRADPLVRRMIRKARQFFQKRYQT